MLARLAQSTPAPVSEAGKALGHIVGWTLFASDLLGRMHALAPLETDDVARVAQFAAAQPDVRPGSADTWTNPRVVTKAIAFLQKRKAMTPAEFDALATQYRSAAFKIAGITDRDFLTTARDVLAASVQRGDSLEQATEALDAAFDAAGYERLKPRHAALVAEMAHATGYGEGQERVLSDDRLAGILPAFRWVTMQDDRVRPTHRAMEGHTAARDAAIWRVWKCPAGYRCRCRKIGVPAAQWSGVSDAWPLYLGHRVQPDEGFAGGDFLAENTDVEVRQSAAAISRLARRAPTGYSPGSGWQVVAVFARHAAAFVRALLRGRRAASDPQPPASPSAPLRR